MGITVLVTLAIGLIVSAVIAVMAWLEIIAGYKNVNYFVLAGTATLILILHIVALVFQFIAVA